MARISFTKNVRAGEASGASAEDMRLLEEDGIIIRYGDLELKVGEWRMIEARQCIAEIKPDRLPMIMVTVEKSLRRGYEKIMSGRFRDKVADDFMCDLVLWEAYKEKAVQ